MANIGLAKPLIAKLVNEVKPSYADGFYCGRAIQVDVTPNYSEGSLYGDNALAEYNKEFRDGDISLNTTNLPIASASVMFGHAVEGENQVIYKSGDEANYVGVGFVTKKVVDGVTKHTGNVIYKVKFTEGQETHTTKGENIEYGTPTISGKIAPLTSYLWKETKDFDTEEEAIAWYEEKLNYIAEFTVTFNVDGGSEVEPQTVARGGLVEKPADPTKTDFTFEGWYKDAEFAEEWNFDSDTVTADTTIYAKWTEA